MNACGDSGWALSGPVILTSVVCISVLLLGVGLLALMAVSLLRRPSVE